MNSKMCATTDIEKCWFQIDWNKAEKYAENLQIRIVKAHKQGRKSKVKSLQFLLTNSFYAKALAVKRVTQNKGKNTAGVDGELWLTPSAKYKTIFKLQKRGYKPKPLKRIYIPKKNGKKRPLSIPTMTDRAMQTLYKLALEPIAETTADPNSYGFRAKRCTQDAIEQCFISLNKRKSPKWVLEGDIKGCFDNISHQWILENIPINKKILKKWLKSGYIETKRLFPTRKGTPQGSAISPIICNMVLDGIEKELKSKIRKYKIKGKVYFPKVNFIRYADDFIVTGYSKEILEDKVKPIITEFLKKRGLELSEEKTIITHIEDGFDFLGTNIRMYNNKLLIKPSKKNFKNVIDKIRNIIKTNKTIKQEFLINKLNPIIRGWVNYHKYNVSSKAFEKLDYEIWNCLWKWCKRRHPNKGRRWIAKKYFHLIGQRAWTFSKALENKKDEYIRLIYATDTNIRRFTKIKSEANPFDENWQDYFLEREEKKMLNNIKGRKILEKLWKEQQGNCIKCGNKITVETDFRLQKENNKIYFVHPYCYKKSNKNELVLEDL
ncbi:group II intron reverse transcriptase/maturase [uncultured Tyzzerella sp.]|uniref:group II intron reverse transcriptase/maturase n=1 Tax=uncultured Tyzzerella sp. TaxID=2321398 RepID=UPI002943C2FC|nr:group II intron reverse transcriptase/maturase [uncultured Tyzzerella sp.]